MLLLLDACFFGHAQPSSVAPRPVDLPPIVLLERAVVDPAAGEPLGLDLAVLDRIDLLSGGVERPRVRVLDGPAAIDLRGEQVAQRGRGRRAEDGGAGESRAAVGRRSLGDTLGRAGVRQRVVADDEVDWTGAGERALQPLARLGHGAGRLEPGARVDELVGRCARGCQAG